MNTSNTANKPGSLPLERKNSPAPQRPVVDNPAEQTEGIDRVGFFDEVLPDFDATSGSIDFNPNTVVSPSTVSEMFGGSDQWISITPSNITSKVVDTASTVINTVGSLAPDAKDALGDLVMNQMIGREDKNEGASTIDPTAAAKKQEEENKMAEYSANRQKEESVEAQIFNIRREMDIKAQQEPIRQEVSAATGIQSWLADIVNPAGEVRTDLVAPLAQKRKEILASQQAAKNPISSPAKHGAEGHGMSMKDRDSQEKQGQTAQTATG